MPQDDPYRDEPYHARLRRLRDEKGLSRGQLYKRTRKTSIDSLVAYEKDPGDGGRTRYPSVEALEDVAQALGVEPAVFPEYQLARARDELDERVVGLGRALVTLSALQGAQRESATGAWATAGERRSGADRRHQATGTEGPTPPAGDGREP